MIRIKVIVDILIEKSIYIAVKKKNVHELQKTKENRFKKRNHYEPNGAP